MTNQQHWAHVYCQSCDGKGTVDGAACPVCQGNKWVSAMRFADLDEYFSGQIQGPVLKRWPVIQDDSFVIRYGYTEQPVGAIMATMFYRPEGYRSFAIMWREGDGNNLRAVTIRADKFLFSHHGIGGDIITVPYWVTYHEPSNTLIIY